MNRVIEEFQEAQAREAISCAGGYIEA